MTNEIVAQDAYIDWDDYHAEYDVEVRWVGRVEPFGEWQTLGTWTAKIKDPVEVNRLVKYL